jgi:large subunit ribosomal protein L15
MPLHRRLPKRGFTNIFGKKIAVINIRDLKRFESGTTVDEALLVRSRIVKGKRDGIKLLGKGEIDYPLTIALDQISKSAAEKIKAAGGSIEVVNHDR